MNPQRILSLEKIASTVHRFLSSLNTKPGLEPEPDSKNSSGTHRSYQVNSPNILDPDQQYYSLANNKATQSGGTVKPTRSGHKQIL
jgi:hypothetical protein